MWKLLRFPSATSTCLRYLSKTPFCESHCAKPFRRSLLAGPKSAYTFSAVRNITFVLTGGTLVQIYLSSAVHCDGARTRLAGFRKTHVEDLKFDWKQFWAYLRPQIWYFLAAVFGALIVALLNIEIPRLMGAAINVVVKFSETKDSELFIREMRTPAFKLILMYLGQSASTFFYIYMLSNIGEKIAYQMRRDLFASIIRQDIAFFDVQRTGEIINRLTTDVQDFKSSFKQVVSGGLRATTQIIGCSISLVLISPQMTLVTLLCVPSIIVVGTIFGAILRKTSRRAQAQIEKTTAVADEAIANIRTVRAFAMEAQEEDLFDSEAELAMQLNQTLGFGIGLFQAGTNMFLNGMVLSTVYMGGYLLSTNQLSAGEMMAFLMASQTIQRSLAQISLLFGAVVRGASAGARVFEYIKMQPTMSLTGGKTIPDESLKGEIEFKDVTFAYPSRPEQAILKNFNLKVPPGKTIAIVGASGNGKTTVVALLERFYDANGGSITLDGVDVSKLDPSWLRRNALGLISQEPILFGTTVLENIRYGKPDATDEEVRDAARLANADEFIATFPRGYDTLVGERGATLSGGQKQRIAIARALLKDPRVLLLDEATSALDAESEKIVQSALDQAKHGRTVIIIAHRLSTVQNADVIVVLHKGKIIEMGTHDSLQKQRGYYWSLTFQQQHTPAG